MTNPPLLATPGGANQKMKTEITYGRLNAGKRYLITVSDTTYEGWPTYLVDGRPAYCDGPGPDGWVALQAGVGNDAVQAFVREQDLPNFRESFMTPV